MLKDIFNPSDMAAMELDSVYQLKNICKDFYRKKQMMSSALIETLDAISNERPAVLQMKRRHFNPEVAPNKREALEWMRINAERERIFRFKSIAKDTATQYYTILDRFSQELLNPKQRISGTSPGLGGEPLSASSPGKRLPSVASGLTPDGENNKEEEAKGAVESKTTKPPANRGKNFKEVMSSAYKEN